MANLDITLGTPSESSARFNFVRGADGDVAFDETEAHAVMTSAMERRGGYWADAQHGSLVFQLQNLTTRTPSQSEAMVADSLSFLESIGAIKNVTVRSTASRNGIGGGRLGITISWTTAGGQSGLVSV